MEILTVSKGESISTDEIKRLFKTSEDLEELKEKVEKAKDRLFIGWDTVEIRDREDEKIPIDERLIRKYEVYVKERNGSISDTHTSKIIGQTLDYKPMKHPKTGKMAILTLNKIFNNYKIDDQVWKELQSGERIGLSVAGESHKQEDKIEANKPIKELQEMDILEKASIGPDSNPCNPEALNIGVSQIAKSKEIDKSFGDYESFEHCLDVHSDAEHPEAWCIYLHHEATGKWPTEKTIKKSEEKRVEKKLDNLNKKLDKI